MFKMKRNCKGQDPNTNSFAKNSHILQGTGIEVLIWQELQGLEYCQCSEPTKTTWYSLRHHISSKRRYKKKAMLG